MGKARAGRCQARAYERHAKVGAWRAQARNRYYVTRTQRALSTSVFGDVNCVACCVCGTCTMHRAKDRQGDCMQITRGIPCSTGWQLLRVSPLPHRSVAGPPSSLPTDMLKRVLSSLGHCLVGHQTDRGSPGNGTTSHVASAVCTGRGTQPGHLGHRSFSHFLFLRHRIMCWPETYFFCFERLRFRDKRLD